MIHASDTEQRYAFWALRGRGAGSLGVVTSTDIDLYPVSSVYAGNRWPQFFVPLIGELVFGRVVVVGAGFTVRGTFHGRRVRNPPLGEGGRQKPDRWIPPTPYRPS